MNKLIRIVVGSTFVAGIFIAPRPALATTEGQCPNVIGSTVPCSSGSATWLPSGNRCHLSTAYYNRQLFPSPLPPFFIVQKYGPYYYCCTYVVEQQFCGNSATGNDKEYFRTKTSGNGICSGNRCLDSE